LRAVKCRFYGCNNDGFASIHSFIHFHDITVHCDTARKVHSHSTSVDMHSACRSPRHCSPLGTVGP
jgi:hypothetical protein